MADTIHSIPSLMFRKSGHKTKENDCVSEGPGLSWEPDPQVRDSLVPSLPISFGCM